jgi:hypothetical protein
MADYKKMYLELFNNLTDAIELLKDAQRRAEEIYIESEDEPHGKTDNKEDSGIRLLR